MLATDFSLVGYSTMGFFWEWNPSPWGYKVGPRARLLIEDSFRYLFSKNRGERKSCVEASD